MNRYNRMAEEIGCIVCWDHYGVQCFKGLNMHHIREAGKTGMAMRASDEETIPLCKAHHQVADDTDNFKVMKEDGTIENMVAYHNRPVEFESRYGTQESLLEKVNIALEKGVFKPPIFDLD